MTKRRESVFTSNKELSPLALSHACDLSHLFLTRARPQIQESLETSSPMPDLVLLHGLLGWAEERRPLYGWMPDYFPLASIRRKWDGDVVAVELGAASSDHDRACEAFAHLPLSSCGCLEVSSRAKDGPSG